MVRKLESSSLIAMIFAAAFSCAAHAEEFRLPSIDDPEFTEQVRREPRSLSAKKHDQIINYYNSLNRIAAEQRKLGRYENALIALYAAAKVYPQKVDHNTVMRGYILGELDRWIEAKREFDKCINNSRWNIRNTKDIATFCLEHNQPRIAYAYIDVLKQSVEDPEVTLLLSKVLNANNESDGARLAAERALYLCHALGKATTDAAAQVKLLTGKDAEPPVANKSGQEEFWKTLEKLETQGKIPAPQDLDKIVSPPTFVNGYIGTKPSHVVTAVSSDSLTGAIRRCGLQVGPNNFASNLFIAPNILTCSLSKDDVKQHVSNQTYKASSQVREKLGSTIHGTHGATMVQPDSLEYDYSWGSVCFEFAPNGFGTLNMVRLSYKTPGPQLMAPAPPQVNVTWTDCFKKAKSALAKRQFKECKKRLCDALIYWDDAGTEQVGKSRRADYESMKEVLIDLYTKWNKPEIAEYFKVVPYCQLRYENQRLFGGEVEEFPTVSEFRHDMWTVRGNREDPYYMLDIKGVGSKMSMRGSSLFKQLVTVVGDTHDESKSIFPIEGRYMDDEDFASNKPY